MLSDRRKYSRISIKGKDSIKNISREGASFVVQKEYKIGDKISIKPLDLLNALVKEATISIIDTSSFEVKVLSVKKIGRAFLINIDISNILEDLSLVYNEKEKIVEIRRSNSTEVGDKIKITKEEVSILLINFLQGTIHEKIEAVIRHVSEKDVGVEFSQLITDIYPKIDNFFKRIEDNENIGKNRLIEEFETYLEKETREMKNDLFLISDYFEKNKIKDAKTIIKKLVFRIKKLKFHSDFDININLKFFKETLDLQIGRIIHDLNNCLSLILGGLDLIDSGTNNPNAIIFVEKGIERIKNYIEETECILTEKNPAKIIKAINKILGKEIEIELNTDIKELDINFLFVILYQLVENAKFHGKAKKVEISINQEDEGIKIIVKDDGDGIDLAKLNASDKDKEELGNRVIFKKRVSSKVKDGGSGNYFVKNLTEEYHGGEILDIKSQRKTENKDGYTEFVFFFPNKNKVDQKS